MSERAISFGILTVSDTCFRGEKEDTSGKQLTEIVKNTFPNSFCQQALVPDEKHAIIKALVDWIDKECTVILTSGGTGFSQRDVTPEATQAVIERPAPGIIYAMITQSLQHTPMAMLSRAISGIAKKSIIINLPGSAKGAIECFAVIQNVIPHAVALLLGDEAKVGQDHSFLQGLQTFPSNFQHSKVKFDNIAARSRQSTYPLIDVSHALEIIQKETIQIANYDLIPIEESLNRILAEDVYSIDPLPPFNASIKDGYAVLARDGDGKRTIVTHSAAGDAPNVKPLQTGEAVRICTGAPVPQGADAVVQVEDTILLKTSEDGAEEIEIEIKTKPKVGQDIRKIGTDIAENTKILEKNQRISAACVGVLAAVGKSRVTVYKRCSIGVVSSGNELVHHSQHRKAGQIRDSNKLTIINLLKQFSFESSDCGIAHDEPDSLKYTLEKAFQCHDVVITSGGVSMGEYDLVKRVLIEDFGAAIHFGRINMKPGKPTTFATLVYNKKPKIVFGLPGNPASSSVTCLLFVVQTLRYLEQALDWKFALVNVLIEDTIVNTDIRPEFVRVNIRSCNSLLRATPTGNQISSRLNSLVGANGLLVVPGKSIIEKDYAQAYVIGELI